MGCKAITDHLARIAVCTSSCCRVEDILHPMKVDCRICIPALAACEMPSGRRMSCPRVTMCGGWPDNERFKTTTVRRNTLNHCDERALHSRSSVVTEVILTYKYSQRLRYTEHHSRFVHVVTLYILLEYHRLLKLASNKIERLFRLVVDIDIASLPIHCLQASRFQLRMTPEECRRPLCANDVVPT